MMPRGNELLLPVNPVFIWTSLLMALVLNQHTSLHTVDQGCQAGRNGR